MPEAPKRISTPARSKACTFSRVSPWDIGLGKSDSVAQLVAEFRKSEEVRVRQ